MMRFMDIVENNVEQTLQEVNRDFFAPHNMQLDLLKNHPQMVLIIAEWIYNEWRSYDSSLTLEKLVLSFSARLNSDRIPMTFVVLKNQKPIATISLKYETTPEFSDFPKNVPWIGSLQIDPQARYHGIGSELLKLVQTVARQFGHDTLYVYTSKPENVNWYLKRGANLIEERPFRNHTINIMNFVL